MDATKFLKLIFLILFFSILMDVVLADTKCRFNVEGSEAQIIDNCNVIETREGDSLIINFTKCKVLGLACERDL